MFQVRPLEDQFKFGSFFTPLLHESDFEAKPSVLLLGQYSTGGATQLPWCACHVRRYCACQQLMQAVRWLKDSFAVRKEEIVA